MPHIKANEGTTGKPLCMAVDVFAGSSAASSPDTGMGSQRKISANPEAKYMSACGEQRHISTAQWIDAGPGGAGAQW